MEIDSDWCDIGSELSVRSLDGDGASDVDEAPGSAAASDDERCAAVIEAHQEVHGRLQDALGALLPLSLYRLGPVLEPPASPPSPPPAAAASPEPVPSPKASAEPAAPAAALVAAAPPPPPTLAAAAPPGPAPGDAAGRALLRAVLASLGVSTAVALTLVLLLLSLTAGGGGGAGLGATPLAARRHVTAPAPARWQGLNASSTPAAIAGAVGARSALPPSGLSSAQLRALPAPLQRVASGAGHANMSSSQRLRMNLWLMHLARQQQQQQQQQEQRLAPQPARRGAVCPPPAGLGSGSEEWPAARRAAASSPPAAAVTVAHQVARQRSNSSLHAARSAWPSWPPAPVQHGAAAGNSSLMRGVPVAAPALVPAARTAPAPPAPAAVAVAPPVQPGHSSLDRTPAAAPSSLASPVAAAVLLTPNARPARPIPPLYVPAPPCLLLSGRPSTAGRAAARPQRLRPRGAWPNATAPVQHGRACGGAPSLAAPRSWLPAPRGAAAVGMVRSWLRQLPSGSERAVALPALPPASYPARPAAAGDASASASASASTAWAGLGLPMLPPVAAAAAAAGTEVGKHLALWLGLPPGAPHAPPAATCPVAGASCNSCAAAAQQGCQGQGRAALMLAAAGSEPDSGSAWVGSFVTLPQLPPQRWPVGGPGCQANDSHFGAAALQQLAAAGP